MVLSPLVPVYTLANHIYYESRLHRARRLLQTWRDDLGEGGRFYLFIYYLILFYLFRDAISDQEMREFGEARRLKTRARVDVYRDILLLDNKAMKYRKLYSYFR